MKKALLAGVLALMVTPNPAALADSFKSYLDSPVQNLDPLFLNSTASKRVGQLVHQGLVAYSPTLLPPKNGAYHQIVPALASSWSIGPDKKSYIFTLNPEARFHNGRKITAADVKYSLERAANPNLNSPHYSAVERLNIKGLRRYQAARRAGIKEPHLLGVEVIDHEIVQLQLENPIPYALELLALPIFSIVPAEDVERWWKDYRTHPVGAGPYQIDELKKGEAIELKRFDKYFQAGVPRTAQIHFDLLPKNKEQFLAFTRQELDFTPVPSDYFLQVLGDPNWNPLGDTRVLNAESLNNLTESKVVKVPSWTTEYISMNNQSLPFNDPKVRQAFNYAVDKRFLINQIQQSYAQPVRGVFPPHFPGAQPGKQLFEHDPGLAQKLLYEAGWRDKDGDGDLEPWQNPHLNLVLYYGSNENSYLTCRKIQSDLAVIGVTVTLSALQDYANYGSPPDFYHASWTPEIIDPSQLFYPTFYSQMSANVNTSRYHNSRVDQLLGQAEDLTYEPRRYELYQEAERHIVDDAPWLFLYHPVNYYLVQPRVTQFMAHPVLPFAYQLFDMTAKTAQR